MLNRIISRKDLPDLLKYNDFEMYSYDVTLKLLVELAGTEDLQPLMVELGLVDACTSHRQLIKTALYQILASFQSRHKFINDELNRREDSCEISRYAYANMLLSNMGTGKAKALGYLEGGSWRIYDGELVYKHSIGKWTEEEIKRGISQGLTFGSNGQVYNKHLLQELIDLNTFNLPAELSTVEKFIANVRNHYEDSKVLTVIHVAYLNSTQYHHDGRIIALPFVIWKHFDNHKSNEWDS
jgi:hypothetical protein